MDGEGRWICIRQRAGPLVKEQRAIRPRLSQYDSPYERAEKNKILRPPRDSGVCRTRMDRLELLLALFGFDGWSYTLTFDEAHLPPSFAEVRLCWRRLLYRMKKWHDGVTPDYVYLIEGRHGDHRYHMHLTVRYCSTKDTAHQWRATNLYAFCTLPAKMLAWCDSAWTEAPPASCRR